MDATARVREAQAIRWLVRGLLVFFAGALLIYPADWTVWKLRTIFGGGMSSVQVSHVTVAKLKANKEEYYSDSPDTVACSWSLFPQNGYSACWWLHRHPQLTDRY